MRIDGGRRPGAADRSRGKSWSGGSGGAFGIPDGGTAARSGGVAGAPAIAGLDALLALQSVGAPMERGARLKHGHAMLDLLDELKLELLSGGISPGRLERLVETVSRRPERHPDDRVEHVLDEIELRARVELAKHGREAA